MDIINVLLLVYKVFLARFKNVPVAIVWNMSIAHKIIITIQCGLWIDAQQLTI